MISQIRSFVATALTQRLRLVYVFTIEVGRRKSKRGVPRVEPVSLRSRYATTVASVLMVLSTCCVCADEQLQLAIQGTEILKARCYGCHGEKFNGSAQFNVMDSAGLLVHGYVLQGNAAESAMWQRIASGEMPPEDSGVPPLSEEERSILLQWIDAGAPQVQRQQRPFKTNVSIVEDIYQDLTHAARDDRPYLRYFTLTHLSNNYAEVTDHELRLYRAAFSKAINSLSYEPDIYVPDFVDAEQTVFRIDLRRLGWDAGMWKWLIGQYPYGVHYENHEIETVANWDEQIDALSGTDLCWMRADWFVNAATRPPIYNRFARIPEYDYELEKRLNVSFEKNYRQDRLVRAGFTTSGVSNGNRLVERHPALHGYYWKSYDFAEKGAAGNLFRQPLGPAFKGNPYPNLSFQHDGGEMIFSLPNGLQAYMLCDAHARRIDIGPIEVVRDSKETAGTTQVVNGISCMHCHRHGMIGFQDNIREGVGVFGDARRKVRKLYPVQEEMDRYVVGDSQRFMNALDQAIGPFLRVGEDSQKAIAEFAEPIGAVCRFYQRDITPERIAFELGIETPGTLKNYVEANRQLIGLGLGPLVQDNEIKRSDWENRDSFVSPFQETARIMGLATPIN